MMTECERLVEEGFINESFLSEEVRNDYLISKDQKKCWAIQLDLLRVIIQLCEERKLRYWVFGGTMLGAVRHKGFIPWDDDIDVCMPREDYDKLLNEKPKLDPPYFFRTTVTDDNYYYSYICVCNCNTTFFGFMGDSNCHKGMQVSIIPLDGISGNMLLERFRFKTLKLMSVIGHSFAFNVNPRPIVRILHSVLNSSLIRFDIVSHFRRANRLAAKKEWDEVEKVGLMIYSSYSFERSIYDKKDFEETLYLPFENLRVPVPKGYEGILTVQWGDYMKFPPVEQRVPKHRAEFDMDTPYVEYCKRKMQK